MKRLYLILLTTLLSWQLLAQVVSIGTGTAAVVNPINPDYEFSYSQNIYLASEIGQASGGDIYDITFKCVNPSMPIASSNKWTVYMANTSKASFSSKTDWVPFSELTEVFSGVISISSGKIKITLDTPFEYNGTDNLVIAVDENEFGYNYHQDKFYNSDTPEGGNRSLFYYKDGTNPDPNNPPEALNIEPTIANIDLNFTEVTCFFPTALTSSNVEAETADIAWTAPAEAPDNGYEYYYSTNNTEPTGDEASIETTNSTSASLSGLESHTQYYFWVRSVCSETDKSAWSNSGTFTTTCSSSNTATYEQDFDNEDTFSNSCWTAIFDNCDGSSVDFVLEGGGKAARLNQSSNKSGAIYFISPRLSDLDGNKTISAKVQSEYPPQSWTFEVGIMTDATDVSTFQSIQDISTNITQSWFDVNTNTSAYTGAAGYVVFKYTLPTDDAYNVILIDDFSYENASTVACQVPLEVTVSDITMTSANISWTAPTEAPENGYEYVYSETNTAPTGAGIATNETNFALSGLTANTQYYVWVCSVCGATDYSEWTQAVEFTTPQEIASSSVAAFSFDNQGDLEGWTVVHKEGTASNAGWSTVSVGGNPVVYPYMGTGLAQFNAYSIFDGNSYEFNSPAINLSGLNYQVRFHMYRDQNSPDALDKVEVFYNTTPGTEGGTSLGVINRNKDAAPAVSEVGWHEYILYIPGTPNGQGYISFLGTSEYGYDIFIDEVVIEEVPACIKPSDIAYSDITSSSVNVSWTASSSSPSTYEYYYSEENTIPGDDVTVSGTTNEINVIIDNLSPISNYYVWVRSACSDEDKSDWAYGGEFQTDCGALTIDFVETFDDVTYGELPPCWSTQIENESGSYGTISTTYTSGNSEDLYVKIANNDDTDGAYYVISPKFSDFDNQKQISLKVQKDLSNNGSNDDNSGVLEVGVMTDPTDVETYTMLHTIALSTLPEAEWKEVVFNTASYTGGSGVSIAVKYIAGTSTYNKFYINDIRYQELPSCFSPLNISFENITASSVDVSWQVPSVTPSNGYEYYYATENTEPTEETEALGTSNATNVSIAGLESTTRYYFWMRSVCSDSDKSAWSEVTDFKTLCSSYTVELTENFDAYTFGQMADCWTTQLINTGLFSNIQIDHSESFSVPNSVRMDNSVDVLGNYYLISPALSDLNNTKEVSFQINRKVLLESSTDKFYTMEVGVMTDASDVSTYQMLQDITQVIEVDTWTEVSVNTTAYAGGEGHLVVKWSPHEGGAHNRFFIDDFRYVEAEEVACAVPSGIMATDLTSTTATLSWAAPLEAPAGGFEYVYSVNNTTPTENGTATNETSVSLSDLEAETQYFVWVRSVCSDDEKSDWSMLFAFTTPAEFVCETPTDLTATNITESTAIISWTAPEEAPANGYQYVYSENNTTPTEDGMATDETSISLDGLTAETQYYVWVRSICSDSDTSDWSSVLNFVTPEEFVCQAPTEVMVSEIAATTASISWTAPTEAPANGYEYVCSENNTVPTEAGLTTDETSVSLSNLNAETQYFVWVRSVCSDDDKSDWTSVVAFTTTAVPCDMPMNVVVTDITESTASISWSAPANGSANAYEYVYSLNNTAPTESGLATDETSVSLSDLNAETQYFVWVRSVCSDDDNSDWTSVVTFTTTAVPCDMPMNVVATNITATTAVISWNAPANGSANAYEYIYSETNTAPATDGTMVTETSVTLSDLNEETQYFVWVRSVCGDNEKGDWTSSIHFTTTSTSVEEIEMAQADTRIYPNPFTSVVTVTNINHVAKIEVVDIVGKLTKVFEPQKELNMSDLQSGLYMINITYTDGSVKSLKVAKK